MTQKGGFLKAAIWAAFVAYAAWGGWMIGRMGDIPPPPLPFVLFALIMALIFPSAAILFFGAHFTDFLRMRRPDDPKYGASAYCKFMDRFGLVLLPVVLCLIGGAIGLLTTHLVTQSAGGYFMSAFGLFCGVGFLAAYLISLKFPPDRANDAEKVKGSDQVL